ncbi:MAG: DUF2306 domain-containing protein [Sphingomonas sp.]|nr:DUF2306 domain-containing protein [Sphingomonas sp.]
MTPQTRTSRPQPLPPFAIPAALIGGLSILAGMVLLSAAAALSHGVPAASGHRLSWALLLHLGTVIPALLIGAAILLLRKGTALHKLLGRLWVLLMMVTAIGSFWLRGSSGNLSLLHLFSIITIVSVPLGLWQIARGNVRKHQRAMLGTYLGLLGAGVFAFLPGRLLGDLFFGLF